MIYDIGVTNLYQLAVSAYETQERLGIIRTQAKYFFFSTIAVKTFDILSCPGPSRLGPVLLHTVTETRLGLARNQTRSGLGQGQTTRSQWY